jgi:hypothetical protein
MGDGDGDNMQGDIDLRTAFERDDLETFHVCLPVEPEEHFSSSRFTFKSTKTNPSMKRVKAAFRAAACKWHPYAGSTVKHHPH